MTNDITRRDALALGISAAALATTGASAQTASNIKAADVAAPAWPIEKGASLRMLRPVRFVKADEDVFRANVAKFTEKTGVEVKVDFVGWEDINQQTAVTSNSGAGPDIIMGFSDAPHIYVDKLIELTDVADYLDKRYGGWLNLAQRYGKKNKSNAWIGLPFGASGGPLIYRKSILQSLGYDKAPDDHAGFLELCKKLQKAGKPAGFALGNAVGDGNGFASWLLWTHNASLLDEEGNVIINSKETIAALKYLKELYPTLIPGTPSWNDVSNNRAYSAGEIAMTFNGVSLYFSLKNDPATGPDRGRQRASIGAEGPGADLADGRTDLERHGVQAQPLSQRRQVVAAIHDGKGTIRALAQRQLGLLVAAARRLRGCRGVVRRSQGQDLQGHHEEHVLQRLQGTDLDGDRRRQCRLRAGADVRFGRDRRRHPGGRRSRSGTSRQALLQEVTQGVIPGRSEGPSPESRDSGFDATHRPGMTK